MPSCSVPLIQATTSEKTNKHQSYVSPKRIITTLQIAWVQGICFPSLLCFPHGLHRCWGCHSTRVPPCGETEGEIKVMKVGKMYKTAILSLDSVNKVILLGKLSILKRYKISYRDSKNTHNFGHAQLIAMCHKGIYTTSYQRNQRNLWLSYNNFTWILIVSMYCLQY